MRRLGFVGAAQRVAGERLVAAVFEQWRAHWCFSATAPISWECRAEVELEPLSEFEWLAAESPRGCLWFAARWPQLVFAQHAAQVPDDAIRAELVSTAQQALGANLQDALDCPVAALSPCSMPARLGAALNARLLLRATIGEAQLLVLLDATLLDQFLPRPSRLQPLQQRSAVIGAAKLRVRVSMPFASLPVSHVNELSVGDVLQGTTELSKPLNLTISDSSVIATGFLAKRDSQLALLLTPHKQ